MIWQKAKLKHTTKRDGVPINTEFWVVALPPIPCPYDCCDHDHNVLGYITNVISNHAEALVGVTASSVELLGEGADDVGLVEWGDFSANG